MVLLVWSMSVERSCLSVVPGSVVCYVLLFFILGRGFSPIIWLLPFQVAQLWTCCRRYLFPLIILQSYLHLCIDFAIVGITAWCSFGLFVGHPSSATGSATRYRIDTTTWLSVTFQICPRSASRGRKVFDSGLYSGLASCLKEFDFFSLCPFGARHLVVVLS